MLGFSPKISIPHLAPSDRVPPFVLHSDESLPGLRMKKNEAIVKSFFRPKLAATR
jgi:hypothetical protein